MGLADILGAKQACVGGREKVGAIVKDYEVRTEKRVRRFDADLSRGESNW